MQEETLDIVVVGAGISGIDAAYRLKTQLPDASYAVLESRNVIGGTWSFFNFPGIRSDSQLTVFGLPWRPWIHEKDMADAALIRDYLQDAVRDEGIDRKIRFNHRVTALSWHSDQQLWEVAVEADGVHKLIRASFVICASGYYDYEKPLDAGIPGIADFGGQLAHPQFWPSDLDWAGKKVVIIGSGATAITLLPKMAESAGHVTLLQRSPSYVFTIRSIQPATVWLRRLLPAWLANPINWWRCFLLEFLFVRYMLWFPNSGRRLLTRLAKKQLPEDVPVDTHFNPRYNPFEQRLGMTADGDFFRALHQDNCDIVTSKIDTVTEDGVILAESGDKLEADIIVTATGLSLQLLGGVVPTVDGKPVDIGSSMAWRGTMLSGVPNLGALFGYTVQSWTMGCDASVKMLIRVYKHMKETGATSVRPEFQGDLAESKPVVGHSSTYFVKAESKLPRITGESPWYGRHNAVYDWFMLWFGSVTTGMRYTVPGKKDE